MAILQEIRKRSWILIAVVALGLLAFLVEPGSLISNLKQINPNNFGSVNDRVITRDDYNQAMLGLRQQNQNAPESMMRNNAWETAVQNTLINVQAEKAGLEVNEEVLYAYYPDFRKQLEELQSAAAGGDDNAKKQLQQANEYIKSQIASLRNNLYNSLLTTTLLTNKMEVQHAKKNASDLAMVDLVKVDYDNYNKKFPYEVTDSDLQKYIDEHKNLFKREATTSIHYVYFPSTPSAADKSLFDKNINAILHGGVQYDLATGEVLDSIPSFASAANDSIYVAEYSLQNFNPAYLGTQQIEQAYGKEVANWVKTASEKSMFGPYKKDDYTIISKFEGKKLLDSIQSRHILIGFSGSQLPGATRSKEEAEQLANQIKSQVEANPASFGQIAMTTSDDTQSGQRGGQIGWVTDNSGLVPEYMNYLENNPVGSYGVVESPFGYHVINIEAKKQGTAYQLANVVREERASDETESKLYDKAYKFASDIKDGSLQDMVNLATQEKLTQNDVKDINRFQGTLQPLNSDKDEDIISWSFNPDNNVGDSNTFDTTNGDYIIVRITGKTEKGIAQPSQIREQYETIVRNEILAKNASDKLKGLGLDQIVNEYQGVISSDSLSMAQMVVNGSGREPKVVGTAFGLKPSTTSNPVGGNTGIFVVNSKGIKSNPSPMDDETMKKNLTQQNKGQTGMIFQAMRREADVEDDRAKLSDQ